MPNSDCDTLQAILTDARGGYISHDAILTKARFLTGHGLTINSRASELRTKRGLNVECDVRTVNGRKVSYYRLAPLPSGAHPELCSGTECAPERSGATAEGAPEHANGASLQLALSVPKGAYDE